MALAHTILALLSENSLSGYDVSKKFDEGIGCYWKASQQQVYRELGKIESKGWADFETISQAGKPNKKVYRITDEGWKELVRWYAEPTEPTQIREALLVKVRFGYKMPREMLIKELQHRRQMHLDQLTFYQEKEAFFNSMSNPPIDMQFKYLTLQCGISYEENWIKWCDLVLSFLASHPETEQARSEETGGQGH